MNRLLWKEWAEAFPSDDLPHHPTVLKVARALSDSRAFQRWLGHELPIVLPLEPVALIAVAALCRVRNRFGKWDLDAVKLTVPPGRFDEEMAVPGLLDAMWAAGLIENVEANAIWVKSRPGHFPKGYDQALADRAENERRAEVKARMDHILTGLVTPASVPFRSRMKE